MRTFSSPRVPSVFLFHVISKQLLCHLRGPFCVLWVLVFNYFFNFLLGQRSKPGSHVFASSLRASNTKRANVTWSLPLQIMHHGHTWHDYPLPWFVLDMIIVQSAARWRPVQYTQTDTIRQTDDPLVPMVGLVPIEKDIISMVLLVNICISLRRLWLFSHLTWLGTGQFNGPLVRMVRLIPIEKHIIPMVLLVQNKFAFTPSRNALTIIMNIPRSISQPYKTSSLLQQVKTR